MALFSTYSSHFKKNMQLALPIMGGQLGQITVNLADNMMVGRLGSTSLAAVSLANSIFMVFVVLGFGLSFALPPLVSEADASKDDRAISQYFKHSLVLNIGFALLCIIPMYLIDIIMPFLKQDASVVALAKPYLYISAWTMVPAMIFQALRCYSDGLSYTKQAMWAIIVGNVVNICINYVLIFGKFGFPELGIRGAAYGTMISRIVMPLVILYLFSRNTELISHLKACNFKKYQSRIFKKVLSIGVPTSLQGFFEISAFSGATIIMGMIHKDVQAAHQIALSLASITFMICGGLAMAATIRVGNQLGEKNAEGVYQAGFSTMIQVVGFMAVCALFFATMRFWLPTLYINNEKVVDIASMLLLFAAIFQIPDGLQVTVLGALRGLQDVKVPTLITFVSYWLIGIPFCYFTAIVLDWGASGVWIGLILGLTVSAILNMKRFYHLTMNLKF